MARTFEWVDAEDRYYDNWLVFENGIEQGGYFVPRGITGQQYDDALTSAKNKLTALGFTEIEITALLGRQLF
jgi:hypothetical protein